MGSASMGLRTYKQKRRVNNGFRLVTGPEQWDHGFTEPLLALFGSARKSVVHLPKQMDVSERRVVEQPRPLTN
jgi:hypothetical protein